MSKMPTASHVVGYRTKSPGNHCQRSTATEDTSDDALEEAQEQVTAFQDMAREIVTVSHEMENAFRDLQTRLRCILKDSERVASQTLECGKSDPVEQAIHTSEVAPSKLTEEEALSQEVRLELQPVEYPRLVLGFYHDLWRVRDVRMLRSGGSFDEGVSINIRAHQPESVADLLRNLPTVWGVHEVTYTEDVDGRVNEGGDNNRRILSVKLAPRG